MIVVHPYRLTTLLDFYADLFIRRGIICNRNFLRAVDENTNAVRFESVLQQHVIAPRGGNRRVLE